MAEVSKEIKKDSKRIEELKKLCDRIDPYKISHKDFKDLQKFNISDKHYSTFDEACNELDPFLITNKLLLLLENSIEELEKKKKALLK